VRTVQQVPSVHAWGNLAKKMYISVEATRWVWTESKSERSARLVLLSIAAHCNDDGNCWPGLDTICSHSKLSKNSVLKAIEELVALGEISVERGGRGARDTNHYHLQTFMQSRVQKGSENQNKGSETGQEGFTRVHPNKNLEQEYIEERPSGLSFMDLVNQSIEESQRTHEPADKILARLRHEHSLPRPERDKDGNLYAKPNAEE
jgi:hypothetical protein